MKTWYPGILLLLIESLHAGCAATDEEGERRREAFCIPDYRTEQQRQPSLDTAERLLSEGNRFHFSAMAEGEPNAKKQLLLQAADRFERALAELKSLRAQTRDPRRREELDLLIMQAQDDLNETIRQVPVTGE
jgi:hypothetical protein